MVPLNGLVPSMRTLVNVAAAAALVLVGAGCPLDPPERVERLGIIQVLPEFPADVGVPEAAAVGEPFVVSVRTRGSGCLTAGSTRVRRDGMAADVRPYDLDVGERDCDTGVRFHQHVATLSFDQAGPAAVRFIGIGYPGGEIVTVTRTVTITTP